MTDALTTIFTNMSRWRHLPAYQLERRADIFFSAYLPAVIAEHTGVPVVADVIPELPIRRDLIWPAKPSRSSVSPPSATSEWGARSVDRALMS